MRDFGELYEDFDSRIMTGFGGVAEYGITVRWDKNFLKVIYLTLVRRRTFRCYGGMRFGGTLTHQRGLGSRVSPHRRRERRRQTHDHRACE